MPRGKDFYFVVPSFFVTIGKAAVPNWQAA